MNFGLNLLEKITLYSKEQIMDQSIWISEIKRKDTDLRDAINIRNMGLTKIGRGTPEFAPVEIGALPAMATRSLKREAPCVSWGRMSLVQEN